MPKSYGKMKDELRFLDARMNLEEWLFAERLISQADRSHWLLASARRHILGACFIYFAVLLSIGFVSALYFGIFGPFGFIGGAVYKIKDLAISSISGGGIAAIASTLAIPATYLIFSQSMKHYSLFRLPSDVSVSGSGGFWDGGMGYNIYTISTCLLSVIIFSVVSRMSDGNQVSSWWQVAIAAGISSVQINEALERVADAINVARNGSIGRGAGGLGSGPRRYTGSN